MPILILPLPHPSLQNWLQSHIVPCMGVNKCQCQNAAYVRPAVKVEVTVALAQNTDQSHLRGWKYSTYLHTSLPISYVTCIPHGGIHQPTFTIGVHCTIWITSDSTFFLWGHPRWVGKHMKWDRDRLGRAMRQLKCERRMSWLLLSQLVIQIWCQVCAQLLSVSITSSESPTPHHYPSTEHPNIPDAEHCTVLHIDIDKDGYQ